MPLSSSQKRYLRSLAHSLKPVIMVGQKGFTEAVFKEFDIALAQHELIKMKLACENRDELKVLIKEFSTRSGAELVQAIGRVACYYRRHPKEPKLALPK